MSFDGSFCSSGSGVGIVFKSPNSVIYTHAIRIDFPCTNNEVEYEALILVMIISIQMKFDNLVIIGDL